MLQFILIYIFWAISHFGNGYLYWRCIYYGSAKYWYYEYKEDYTKLQVAKDWKKAMPIIVTAGILNWPIAFLSGQIWSFAWNHGITLDFKIPEQIEQNEDQL